MALSAQSIAADAIVSSSDPDPTHLAVASKPALCMKLLPTTAPPQDATISPAIGLTSKEWVVPPRPKPGRKPATDTPPTKRKAQNRAAQRAFRERRAARVGELEEQLRQIEEEYEHEQDSLRSRISKLESEIEHYQSELTSWIDRYKKLETTLTGSQSDTVRVPLTSEQPPDTSEVELIGCGNCTPETRCQCLDDTVNAMAENTTNFRPSRTESPAPTSVDNTRPKQIKMERADSMEIDFTATYSSSGSAVSQHQAIPPSPAMADPCGFCQDGTPCICAEMAAERQPSSTQRSSHSTANNNRPLRQLAQFTPPPSEGDVAQLVPSTAVSCATGPGTCTQCQTDPNSTLFCKSLAASRALRTSATSGCCGGKGPDGSCCQSQSVAAPVQPRMPTIPIQLPPLQNSTPSITLSCADAYTTLSRHPAYERASSEIATWMPKLYANPSGVEGRPAMEIDAANVMSVLRDFDRRFGSNR